MDKDKPTMETARRVMAEHRKTLVALKEGTNVGLSEAAKRLLADAYEGDTYAVQYEADKKLVAEAALAAPVELAAALGWPGGISEPVADWPTLLRMVASLRATPEDGLRGYNEAIDDAVQRAEALRGQRFAGDLISDEIRALRKSTKAQPSSEPATPADTPPDRPCADPSADQGSRPDGVPPGQVP